MKKFNPLVLLGLLSMLLFTACNNDDDASGDSDTSAPVIGFAEGRDGLRPGKGEVRSSAHMHVRFSVTDNAGLANVTVGVAGRHAGSVANGFELLAIEDVYSATADNEIFRFEEGAKSLNVDSRPTDIYWDMESPDSRTNVPILTGPYDFSITATDINGNTTVGEAAVNHRFYAHRPYGPALEITNLEDGELEGEPGEALSVEGTVGRGEGSNASDLVFLWVRLVEEDEHNDFEAGSAIFDKKWGASARIAGLRGDSLPSGSINLAEALAGAIVLPAGEAHYDLIIWAEDANGNVTRMSYEVHGH
ncbi:MAG: DUF4625 domain-containing protein [Bernardetiaceae bacterium]|nr:DUF4625 domain-containing protein [Bernardetiaceae bacterium]